MQDWKKFNGFFDELKIYPLLCCLFRNETGNFFSFTKKSLSKMAKYYNAMRNTGASALKAYKAGMSAARRVTGGKKSSWLIWALVAGVAALFFIKKKDANGESQSLISSFFKK